MKLFLDLKNRRFVKSAASNVALDRLILKRRDTLPIEVVYVENGATATPPAGTTAAVGLKAKFSDANFLAYAAPGETTLVLNTIPVEAAFSSNPASISALLEIRWGAPSTAHRTATLAVELQNSVITGDEATPAAIPDGKATQAEATTGTDNTKWMTPLRTAQAIEALAEPAYFGTTQPPAGSNYKFWVNTSTGRQFALIGGQWLETSGSSTGALGGTGHTHAIADVTNLSTSLAEKISGTGVASMQVVTALPASPAPTTFYIVIPSGATTASAVTLGSVSLLTGGGSGGGGGGGGETVWTPASLTSLALWLDATSGLYDSTSGGALLTTNGSAIGRWEDRSTNARHFTQSTVNSRPVLTTASLNGKNTITFDGADDSLSLASAPGLLRAKTGATLLAVLKHKEILSTAGKPVFRVGGIRRFESRRIGTAQRSIVTRRLDSDPTTDARAANGSVSSDFELIADAIDYSASTVFMYKNGVLIFQNPLGTTGATSDTDVTTISIGVTCNIEIAELIFYDRLLTTAERQQVETYLGTKWGITL